MVDVRSDVMGMAYERLGDTPKTASLRERFKRYYLELAEEAESELRGPDQVAWLDVLEAEHDSLRAAIEWTLADSDGDAAIRMTTALQRFWLRHPGEGRGYLERAAALGPEPTARRARALVGAAELMLQIDSAEARKLADQGAALARELRDSAELARALLVLGQWHYYAWAYEVAQSVAEDALRNARACGGRYLTGRALHWVGRAASVQGKRDEARRCFDEALALAREAGDLAMIANDLYPLIVHSSPGPERALLQEEALRLSRELKDDDRLCEALDGVGWACLFNEGVAPARAAWDEAVETARRMVEPRGLGYYLTIAGTAASYAGDVDAARALLEEARTVGGQLASWPTAELAALELRLGDTERALHLAESAVAMSRDTQQPDNTGFMALGAVKRAQGDEDGAIAAFEEAHAVANRGGHASQRSESARTLAMVAAERGDAHLAKKWLEDVPDGRTNRHRAVIALLEGHVAQSVELHREALAQAVESGERSVLPWSLEGLADNAVALGQHEVAARLLGAAERNREDYGCVREAWWFAGTALHLGRDGYETRIAGLRSSLGDGAFDTAWAEGRAMNEAEAVEYAFTVPLT